MYIENPFDKIQNPFLISNKQKPQQGRNTMEFHQLKKDLWKTYSQLYT